MYKNETKLKQRGHEFNTLWYRKIARAIAIWEAIQKTNISATTILYNSSKTTSDLSALIMFSPTL